MEINELLKMYQIDEYNPLPLAIVINADSTTPAPFEGEEREECITQAIESALDSGAAVEYDGVYYCGKSLNDARNL